MAYRIPPHIGGRFELATVPANSLLFIPLLKSLTGAADKVYNTILNLRTILLRAGLTNHNILAYPSCRVSD